MHVFLTGATGFIGSRILKELLDAGHRVTGLTRSQSGADALKALGAHAYLGSLEEPESLKEGAARADAVIHTAFDHDFSRFVENCEKDRRVILALGDALEGSSKPLIITSGTGIGSAGPGQLATEDFFSPVNPNPRVASEITAEELLKAGLNVSVVRLPQVHDTVKQGFVTLYIDIARKTGVAAYVGDGLNRWPAGHVFDVARLYRLAVEKGQAGVRYHAVAEQGVAVRDIATTVAAGLKLPLKSLTAEEAKTHFGWMAPFASMDAIASSQWTRKELGWQPTGPDLIADLQRMDYRQR